FLLGQFPSGGAVTGVVGIGGLEALYRFFHRREREQSLAGGQMLGKAGVLHEHGPARCEIADSAVAEPAAAGLHVAAFGDAEFAAGLLNVGPAPVQPVGSLM